MLKLKDAPGRLLAALLLTTVVLACAGLITPRAKAQTDPFGSWSPGLTTPATHAFAITPADGSALTYTTRGVVCSAITTLKVDMSGGEAVTFTGLTAGVIHPLRITKVYLTGTTASNCFGLY